MIKIPPDKIIPIGNVIRVFKELGFARYKRFQEKLFALESPNIGWVEKQQIARDLLRDECDFFDQELGQHTNLKQYISEKFEITRPQCGNCSKVFDVTIKAHVRLNKNWRIVKYEDWDIDPQQPVICRNCKSAFYLGDKCRGVDNTISNKHQ